MVGFPHCFLANTTFVFVLCTDAGNHVGVSSVCTYLVLFASAAVLFVLYSGLKGLNVLMFKVTPFLNIIFFIFKVFREIFSDHYCFNFMSFHHLL